jgi:GntR family transcriptional repressor for pyruvate dehydrogenase complex
VPTTSIRRPDAIANRLQSAIQRGEFKPQQALPSERVLAERWKVSRSIVREGIAMLVARGLLNCQQGRGTFVNPPDQQVGAQVWAEMARRHPDLQGSLLEFRQVLECEAAALAAERHDAADRLRLEQAGAAVERAWLSSDRRDQLTTDLAFHQAIAEATQNPIFAYLMASLHRLLLDHMQLSQAGTRPQSSITEQVSAQHRALLHAILARDPDAAAQAAAAHLDFVRVHLNHLQPRRRTKRR